MQARLIEESAASTRKPLKLISQVIIEGTELGHNNNKNNRQGENKDSPLIIDVALRDGAQTMIMEF